MAARINKKKVKSFNSGYIKGEMRQRHYLNHAENIFCISRKLGVTGDRNS